MSKVTVGIDQGLRGALCWMTGLGDSDAKSVLVMPTCKGSSRKRRPDVSKIRDWLNQCIRRDGRPELVVIERTQAMYSKAGGGGRSGGRQPPSSVLTQGFNAGIIVGVFALLGLPSDEPTPQQWKSVILKGYGVKDKSAMVSLCKQRFPSLSLLASKQCSKPHDGIADAVGLAMYGQYLVGNMV